MATGSLKFFNPSSLLPGSDVAINPAPVADHSAVGLALFDAMRQFKETAKQKRDLENLRSETNALADYFGKNSPQLRDYLYNKSNQYDLLTTNIGQERAGLLNGAIGLFGAESQRIKAEREADDILVDNNWKTKVNIAQRQYESLLRSKERWTEEQNNLRIQHDANRRMMSDDGIPTLPFVEQPFPDQAKLDAAEANRNKIAEASVDEIRRDATSRSIKNSIVGTGGPEDDAPAGADNSAPPIVSLEPPPKDSVARPGSLFPEELEPAPTAPVDNTPLPESQLTETDRREALLSESKRQDAVRESLLTPDSPVSSSPPDYNSGSDPNSILPGAPVARGAAAGVAAASVLPDDMFNKAAKQRQAEFQEIQNGRIIDLTYLFNRLQQNRDAYPERVQGKIDELLKTFDQRKKEIEEAGRTMRIGSPAWNERLRNIMKIAQGDMEALRPLTNDEQDRRELAKANEKIEFHLTDDDPKDPNKVFTIVKRIRPSDRRPRLYALDNTGNPNRDVTDMFRDGRIKPVNQIYAKELETFLLENNDAATNRDIPPAAQTQNGNVDVTKPGKLPVNRWIK